MSTPAPAFPRSAYAPLTPYAPDRRPVPVDLSDNTSRWGVHPGAWRVLTEGDPEAVLRYPSVYADRLRDAVARRFGVPVEAVSTGCGSDDLLDSLFRGVTEPGGRVVYLPPTFSMVEIFARMNGLEPAPMESVEAGLPDPAALVDAVGLNGLLYLCRPNNPTGEQAPRAWVQDILTRADAGGVVVLLDEAYADYSGDSFLTEAAASHRIVVVRTLSKLYGLAGLRIGYAVGAPEVIRELEKSRGPYKVNRLAEAAAVAALDDEEGWIAPTLAATLEARRLLEDGLRGLGYAPLPSVANFVLVPVADAMGVTAHLRARGVAVRPFPALPGHGDTVRISVGPAHELETLLAAFPAATAAATPAATTPAPGPAATL
jgi:histidinol-phosphate aminotransferase